MTGTTLFLPVAGRSSRYPGMRPKWLLMHPRGTLMLTEGIRGLNPSQYERVVVVALETQENDFGFSEALRQELVTEYGFPEQAIQIVLLQQETRSQPETIYEGLKRAQVQGPFLVKDSDNYFLMPEMPVKNSVAVIDLNNSKPLLVGNKSYIRSNPDATVHSIVEKQVVSNLFCCGGYFFEAATDFCRHFERLREDGSLYPSSIIQSMLDEGAVFRSVKAQHFEDWGTLPDWIAFKNTYATLFVELDGVVVLDSHRYFEPRWGTTEALRRNVMAINRLYDSGKVEIILISSRRREFAQITEEQLRKNSIKYHRLVFDLPTGCRRILVSGFSEHNAYEAAHAVNLRLNEDRLDEYLHQLLA